MFRMDKTIWTICPHVSSNVETLNFGEGEIFSWGGFTSTIVDGDFEGIPSFNLSSSSISWLSLTAPL